MADLNDPVYQTFRIAPTAFQATQVAFTCVATIAAATRTFVRVRRFRRLDVDDMLLILASITNIVGCSFSYWLTPSAYLQVAVMTLKVFPPLDFINQIQFLVKMNVIASAVAWTCVFSVKLSFLLFFRKLIQRIRSLEIWWWFVTSVTVACGITLIPLCLFICSDFGEGFWEKCPIDQMVFREGIYTKVTVCLDVFSDVLIISVPIALLWNVKISLRRKLELGGVLCLSLFMIAIAIVRVALAELPEGITDTTWLVFWQGIESCVAIITVSIVAFRSLLSPQGSKASKTTPPHERETPNLNSTYGKYSPAGTTPSVTDTWVGSVAYEELEPAKPVARPRQWLPAPVELPPIELPFLNNTDHLDDVSSDDEYDERESSRNEDVNGISWFRMSYTSLV